MIHLDYMVEASCSSQRPHKDRKLIYVVATKRLREKRVNTSKEKIENANVNYIICISIYKLRDVGISSILIGSLSLTNGHCPPPGRWIMKQWPAGVNFCFAEVTENDILRMRDITIPNDTKKAMKLGMIVFRDKQCFNTQFAHMSSVSSSVLIAKLR